LEEAIVKGLNGNSQYTQIHRSIKIGRLKYKRSPARRCQVTPLIY